MIFDVAGLTYFYLQTHPSIIICKLNTNTPKKKQLIKIFWLSFVSKSMACTEVLVFSPFLNKTWNKAGWFFCNYVQINLAIFSRRQRNWRILLPHDSGLLMCPKQWDTRLQMLAKLNTKSLTIFLILNANGNKMFNLYLIFSQWYNQHNLCCRFSAFKHPSLAKRATIGSWSVFFSVI